MNLRVLGVAAAASALALSPLSASAAIDIVFDYTYDTGNFFDAQKRTVLDAAAAVFETRLLDNLTAISSSIGGPLTFNINFFNPADPNNNAARITLNNTSIAANTILVYAGASNLLGGSTLGVGGPGGFSASGSDFSPISRGQAGYTPADGNSSNETDFGPWGGAISFNSTSSWYFGTSHPGTGSGTSSDFYSVAVHELAHLLGMGTARSWSNLVDNGTGVFSGTNSGSVQTSADRGHWQEGTASLVDGLIAQEAAMDPSLLVGTRKYFTDLDWNGMRDIGWQASPVPEPTTYAMLLAGLATLGWLQRRRRGDQALAPMPQAAGAA